jgi:Tol biopolymer transport system component/DNA-binding winged helix-turn-helix (wHTH) protein
MHGVRPLAVKGTFHLADWEVQPQANCLKRADRSFHVEPKVMQVLVELASHCNEVLSKEQLIHAVWPDTFVSDDVLTRCISEIRRVLEDDARAPKFIQTIPKTGYRLIAPVEYQVAAPAVAPSSPSVATPAVIVASSPIRTKSPASSPPYPASSRQRFWLIIALVGVSLVSVFLLLRPGSRQPPPAPPGSYKIVPFTSYPGAQTQPSFSPDGNQIAFVWNGEKGDNQDIYIKMIGTETPLRLTSDPAEDFSPTWSPDGRSIAFLRYSEANRGIYIVSALGGAARKVFTPVGKIEWERGALSWSPDGKYLIFPDGKSSKTPSEIYSLDLATAVAQPITKPPSRWDGDSSPAFSLDGSKIAFVRGIEGYVRDIYVMNAAGGEPIRLTFDDRMVSSVAWTADSSAIIFSSNRAGKYSLWKVSVAGGTPERLPVGSEDAFAPAVSRAGTLAYTQTSSTWSIRRVDLKSSKTPTASLWSSTQQDSAPQFSPDGSKIAFQSWRSGSQEIWVSSSDGSSPVKLTSFEKSLTGSPSWAPDGTQLTFDARPEGRSHIYSIRLDGGLPRNLTGGDFNDIVPSWSRDGRWIYFGSNRSGPWQIWRVPSEGGSPQQVTKQGGFVGTESYDGQWLYFAKADSPGVWRTPVTGGDEQKIVDQPRVGYWGYWCLAKDGIYYLNQSGSPMTIDFANLTGEHRFTVHVLERNPPPFAGLTVDPDGHFLLYSDQLDVGSHITLVEGFSQAQR